MDFYNFPRELRELGRWVMWRKEKKEDGKWTKVPYRPDGKRASATDPADWSAFEECAEAVARFSGVGFVLAGGQVGIDLDHCLGPDGEPEPWAAEILARFDSYTERSPSGDGLHIVIASDADLPGRRAGGVECYSRGRFFTVTGDVYRGRGTLRDLDVMDWHAETFAEKPGARAAAAGPPTYLPEDARILSVMFGARNGARTRALYERGDWAGQGYQSQSQADLALAGTLMFYCGNHVPTADRLFRGSGLMRRKWDERRGAGTYGETTLGNAACEETMRWRAPRAEPEYVMSGGDDPKPMLILENVRRAMESDEAMSSLFRLNEFSHAVETSADGGWRNLQDSDVIAAQLRVSTEFPAFARVSKEMAVDAIKAVAYRRRANPPRDYLLSLSWDGKPRLDTWLMEAYGVPDEEVYRKMGSNWMKGLAKRVLHPGCQFDEVLVLESPQGYRKSTSLRVLGSPWHVESTLTTEDKDFYMLLARNVIVEFSEGDIVGRTSARKLKAVITKTEDSFRPPYEHGVVAFRRGCVFAMTTNDGDYQKDDTGGRRWLPVVLRKVADVDWIAANRDQLYAEAVHRVETLKETTHEYPKERLEELQGEKQESDEYDEIVRVWYDSLPSTRRDAGVTLLESYRDNMAMDQDAKMSKQDEWRMGSIFKRALGLRKKVVRIGGVPQRRWVKP